MQDKVSATDRREIEGRMRNEVLEIAAYPEIRFQASGITAESLSRADTRPSSTASCRCTA